MAIDLSKETLVTLGEAARRLPRRRLGRGVSPSTLWRWHARGVRCGSGRAHLDALRLPSGIVTSMEALQRFFDSLTVSEATCAAVSSSASAVTCADADLEAALAAKGI